MNHIANDCSSWCQLIWLLNRCYSNFNWYSFELKYILHRLFGGDFFIVSVGKKHRISSLFTAFDICAEGYFKRSRLFSFSWCNIDGGTILPLAALLTGAFLTLGVGVLLIVVLAIRKRRHPAARSICDDKDKHLGKISYFLYLFLFYLKRILFS